MTFTEAAAEVLRLAGKALHYKEITELAIEKNLLSHVGKSPEVTMGARLAALLKKEDKNNPIIRVKPGVFGLRDWSDKKPRRGAKDEEAPASPPPRFPPSPPPSKPFDSPTIPVYTVGREPAFALAPLSWGAHPVRPVIFVGRRGGKARGARSPWGDA